MDAPKSKKHGPLSTVGWIAVAGGIVLGYILVRRYEADKASTTAANTAAEPTTEQPLDVAQGEGSSAAAGNNPSGATFTSIQQWVSAMIPAMTAAVPATGTGAAYGNADAFNDVTSWINGSCVTANGYNAISSAIGSVGLPPGFDPGTLSVCANSNPGTTTSTTASTGVAAQANIPWSQVVGSTDAALAQLSNTSFAQQINFGQYTIGTPAPAGQTQMTQVGTIQGGQYVGADVLNGAPLYAGVFGVMQQGLPGDPGFSKMPSGTAIYVPTELVNAGYVKGIGTPTGPT